MLAVLVVASLVLGGPAAADPIRTLLLGDSTTFGIASGAGGPAYAEILADTHLSIRLPPRARSR